MKHGILFNSEGWHGITDDDIRVLEKIDEALIRALIKAHAKVPLEFLYMETGCIPIRHIISSRRMLYLKTLLLRDDEEVTKRVLREQQSHTSPGDFALLIEDDCRKLDMKYDENVIINAAFKISLKKSIRKTAFKELLEKQKEHWKIVDVKYKKLEAQPYLKSSLFTNEDVSLLADLGSHTARGIRCNFKNWYKPNIYCPLKCWSTGSSPIEDTQQHLLVCTQLQSVHSKVVANNRIDYDDIYADVASQKAAVTLFKESIELRNSLLEQR